MRLFFLFILTFSVFLSAGELEEFENDVEFLDSSYKEVERLPTSSPYKNEYRKRMLRAKKRAGAIQRSVERLGIKKTSLDSSLSKMFSFMDIGGVSSRTMGTQAGNMRTYANELRTQIKYLKELNYSYETNTFEDPYPDSNVYEAVHRFESLFRQTERIASGNGYIDSAGKKKYQELFNDLLTLGKEMSMRIQKQKMTLPSGFNLVGNLEAFQTAAEKLISVRGKKDAANSKKLKRLVSDKGYKDSLNSVKYAAGRLDNDLEFLKKNNFSMRVQKTDLRPVADGDRAEKEPEIQDGARRSPEELWKEYSKKKNELFQSESKIRGVSQAFYDRYKAMLSPEQQIELDTYCEKYKKEDLPDEFARSSAVKIIHTKYRFRQDVYSSDFLDQILKKKD